MSSRLVHKTVALASVAALTLGALVERRRRRTPTITSCPRTRATSGSTPTGRATPWTSATRYSNAGRHRRRSSSPACRAPRRACTESIFARRRPRRRRHRLLPRPRPRRARARSGTPCCRPRGRSLYMRGASNRNFTRHGLRGQRVRGRAQQPRRPLHRDRPGQTVTEVGAERFNAPSHAGAATPSAPPASPPT